MLFKKYKINFIALFSVVLVTACGDNDEMASVPNGEMMLMFESKFGNQALTFGETYTTSEGEQIKFSQFRYILSNITLTNTDGSKFLVPDSYYFMGQAADNTKREMLQLKDTPGGTYTAVSFSVGVDADTNTNTDTFEKGELKAGVGMDWSWNSGYKFINWEGSYFNEGVGSNVPFKLHVGTDNNFKTISQTFPSPVAVSGEGNNTVHFEVMADKVFQGISFNEIGLNFAGGTFTGIMAGPADKAEKVANNYAEMFMLHHIERN